MDREPNDPQQDYFSLTARIASVRHALRGLLVMLCTQHNAWIHAVGTVAAIVLASILRVGRAEWLFLVLAITIVWTAEALNTAIERIADVASPEFHSLVEQAKDVAAGAVLLTAAGAAAIGFLVLGPPLYEWAAPIVQGWMESGGRSVILHGCGGAHDARR